jgi:hypothetical protein
MLTRTAILTRSACGPSQASQEVSAGVKTTMVPFLGGIVQPAVAGLTFAELTRLRTWLATAELPEPPLRTMPGVEAYNVELKRQQLLAWTGGVVPDANALLELRYLAAHYGPPEIRALAQADQLPRAPHGPQF